MTVSPCLSTSWPGFNSRSWWSISRDYPWLINMWCLVHTSTKAKRDSGSRVEWYPLGKKKHLQPRNHLVCIEQKIPVGVTFLWFYPSTWQSHSVGSLIQLAVSFSGHAKPEACWNGRSYELCMGAQYDLAFNPESSDLEASNLTIERSRCLV